MSLYWVSPNSADDGELLLADGQEIAALLRAVDFYLYSQLMTAFPGDEVPLATFLERLKHLSGEST